MTKQTTRWFLAELHQQYHDDDIECFVNDADHPVNVLEADGNRFQVMSYEN